MGERFQADRGGPGFQRPVSVKVVVGGAAGRVLGMRSARYVESLLYQVKAAEPDIAALPALDSQRRSCGHSARDLPGDADRACRDSAFGIAS
jgi:hypothetical protein